MLTINSISNSNTQWSFFRKQPSFPVADTYSVFVYKIQITCQGWFIRKEIFWVKNFIVDTKVVTKFGSGVSNPCSRELSCINDLMIIDFA